MLASTLCNRIHKVLNEQYDIDQEFTISQLFCQVPDRNLSRMRLYRYVANLDGIERVKEACYDKGYHEAVFVRKKVLPEIVWGVTREEVELIRRSVYEYLLTLKPNDTFTSRELCIHLKLPIRAVQTIARYLKMYQLKNFLYIVKSPYENTRLANTYVRTEVANLPYLTTDFACGKTKDKTMVKDYLSKYIDNLPIGADFTIAEIKKFYKLNSNECATVGTLLLMLEKYNYVKIVNKDKTRKRYVKNYDKIPYKKVWRY